MKIRFLRAISAGVLVWALGPAGTAWAGLEDFANFSYSGTSYASGSFAGRDGSTWAYVSCRGDKPIIAPSPALNKGANPAASVTSGVLTGGCGTLSFNYMPLFTSAASLDVLINGVVIQTVTGNIRTNVYSTGDITIQQAGNFTLSLVQHDTAAGQVSVDNIAWTAYAGGADPRPPQLVLTPATTNYIVSYSNLLTFTASATEPDGDPVRLWAETLPDGAVFGGATGASPVQSTLAWTPGLARTGQHAVVLAAADKDGTNRQTVAITVEGDVGYYYRAEGKTGTELRDALHDIISSGHHQMTDIEEDRAMRDLDTDLADTNCVMLLYRRIPMAKSLYNADGGWNKEHCWPTSRGLGDSGPDENDAHNLFAADKVVNATRGNLYFDESQPGDPGYLAPAVTNAPETSRDSDSWEPPAAVKGDIARALFYMEVRYDGSDVDTLPLELVAVPTNEALGKMGALPTLLAWHAADPPGLAESNRNEKAFRLYQFNRNPFIDHPEWVALIWETNATPPVLLPIGSQAGQAGEPMTFTVQALPTEGDAVSLTMSNAPAGALFTAHSATGTFTWTPAAAGVFAATFRVTDDDGADQETVSLVVSPGTQDLVLAQYTFDAADVSFTNIAAYTGPWINASRVTTADGTYSSAGGASGQAISDTGWTGTGYTAYFTVGLTVSNGHQVQLRNLQFVDRASATGPLTWRLRSSLDNYAADLASGAAHQNFATNVISLASLAATTGTVTLRVYGQGASSASGTWRMDDLLVGGRISDAGVADDDGDGLPNDWELRYFGSVTGAVRNADLDGDLMFNWQEQVAGTDPTNGLSYLAATIAWAGGVPALTGPVADGGRAYILEAGRPVGPEFDWQPLETVTNAADGAVEFVLPAGYSNVMFRLRAYVP